MNAPIDGAGILQLISATAQQTLYGPAGGYNLDVIADFMAALSSSHYLHTRMIGAKRLDGALELVDFACAAATVEGLVLEFGVYSGRSINRIAQSKPGPVYGFDSFEGLPEAWREGFEKGSFSREDLPEVAPNVELIVGWFDRTLPHFLDVHPGPASLIHVDCDLYSSTQTVFTQLRQRIVPGTIILFDEYFNYPGWELHEFKAFQEFVETTGLHYEYIGLNPTNQQVAVRVTGMFNR
jgi:hypothetical protein